VPERSNCARLHQLNALRNGATIPQHVMRAAGVNRVHSEKNVFFSVRFRADISTLCPEQ
jgi:hypothetical protein